MKKYLLILLIVAMVFGLTSCSPEISSKLGALMGKMGNNVYGITANLAEVNKATEGVDNAVEISPVNSNDPNAPNVVATIDLSSAAKVMESASSIKGSDQKRAALKTSLSEPISNSSDENVQKAIVAGITKSAEDKKDLLDEITTGSKAQLAASISNALSVVESSLSANPTKAELATVAVIGAMADAVVNNGDLAKTGEEALDTLKIVSEFGEMKLINDNDLQSMISSMMQAGNNEKGLSRDGNEEPDTGSTINNRNLLNLFNTVVSKTANMLTVVNENGVHVFDIAKYKSFVLQAKGMKSAYDMISMAYIENPSSVKAYDKVLVKTIDHGLTIEDLIKYCISWAVVEADYIDQLIVEALKTFDSVKYSGDSALAVFIEPFINENYVLLNDMVGYEKDHPDEKLSFTILEDMKETMADIGDKVSKELNLSTTDGKLISSLSDCLTRTGGLLKDDFFRFIGTTVVILVDSEWKDGLFAFVPKLKDGTKVNTVSGLIQVAKESVEDLQNAFDGFMEDEQE